jgi:hypothetical protein
MFALQHSLAIFVDSYRMGFSERTRRDGAMSLTATLDEERWRRERFGDGFWSADLPKTDNQ